MICVGLSGVVVVLFSLSILVRLGRTRVVIIYKMVVLFV